MFNHAIKFEEDFITRGLEVRAHFHEFWMSDMYGDSPAFLSEKRGPELFNVAIAFTVLETIFVILYFSSRVMSKTANGWDVRLILPAYLSNIGLIGCVFIMIKHAGLGRHLVSQTAATAVRFEKINVSVQFIYPVSITLPKLAILCLYRRAFITRSYRYAIIGTATILCLNWLASLVMAIFLCHPFGYLRMQMDSYPNGGCANLAAAYCSISIPNILTDIVILVLPMHAVWNLHTQTSQKIGLTITFLTGWIGLITGTIRLVEFILLARLPDPTWDSDSLLTWTIVEPGVYLIAATPPFMRPLLRRASQEVKASSLYRTMHGRSRTQFLRPAKTSENPSAGHERSGATELLEKEKLKSSSFASSIEADELEHPSKAYVYDPRQSECDTHRACIGTGIP